MLDQKNTENSLEMAKSFEKDQNEPKNDKEIRRMAKRSEEWQRSEKQQSDLNGINIRKMAKRS